MPSATRGVNPAFLARLRVAELHQTHLGDVHLAAVGDAQRDEVVLVGANLHLLLKTLVRHKVRDEEGRGAALDGRGQKTQALTDVGAAFCRLEVDDLADDAQDVRTAFLGRDELLDLAAEENDTHLVVVLDGRKRQDGCQFGRQVTLRLALRAEVVGTRHVDEQHHRHLTLFLEDLDERFVEAGGDIPVDVADVVAVLVLAHLAEGHTTPFEGAVVLSREDVVREASRLNLDFADFLEYFC